MECPVCFGEFEGRKACPHCHFRPRTEGEIVRNRRQLLGLGLQEIAGILRIGVSTVSKYESWGASDAYMRKTECLVKSRKLGSLSSLESQ